MGVLVCALFGAAMVYLNIAYVTRLPGEARVRLLIFKEGANLQDRLLGSPMLREDAANAPTFRQVSQGLQHTWENKAIASRTHAPFSSSATHAAGGQHL
jgi:hypothetical protein